MANNEKLKQIISNLQILKDLTNSMIDSELYPVSFFSQAFDLIQKIQSDIHTLEADQVELFASQMKKHQALILSIHQQMRNISPETSLEQKPTQGVSTPRPIPATNDQKQPVKTINKPEANAPKQTESEQKKPSFFSRFGKKPAQAEETPVIKINEAPRAVHEAKKAESTIIENSINIPAKKTEENKPEAEPKPTAQTAAMPKAQAPTPAQAQAQEKAPAQEKAAPTITAPAAAPVNTTAKSASDNLTTKETNTSQSLNDIIEKKNLSDLRKAFSLNDRFKYRKELFGGNEEAMSKVITILNNKTSFKDSVMFLEEKLHWDFSSPTVKDFVKVLELRFL